MVSGLLESVKHYINTAKASLSLHHYNILTLSCPAQLLVILSKFNNKMSPHQFNLGIWWQKVTVTAFVQDNI